MPLEQPSSGGGPTEQRPSRARANALDGIVDIIRRHGPGGDEPDDEIDLELV